MLLLRSDAREADCESRRARGGEGVAVLLSLIALALFSLIGLYLSFQAAIGLRISDNRESTIRARAAARAGLHHARELLRGVGFDDLLLGPDGEAEASPGYQTLARSFAFRNPLDWNRARTLDLTAPALGDAADDGIMNAGRCTGVVLIPREGIVVDEASGPGGVLTVSRYFVKVTDNNGEASELAEDPADDPFLDGDGSVVVRAMGLARIMRAGPAAAERRNSVAVLEGRFRRRRTFDLPGALTVAATEAGSAGANMFEGVSFLVQGEAGHEGIAVIGPGGGDASALRDGILARVGESQRGNILGRGIEPSIGDATAAASARPDGRLLLDGAWLRDFAGKDVPGFADAAWTGTQDWTEASGVDLGYYDASLPDCDPAQRPRVTFVGGDLTLGGELEGGGLLVVTGRLTLRGGAAFQGLILLIGSGELDALGGEVSGGVLLAACGGGWGAAKLTIGEASRIVRNDRALEAAIRLIPPDQPGYREITLSMDP